MYPVYAVTSTDSHFLSLFRRKKIWKTGVLQSYSYMYDIMLITDLLYKINLTIFFQHLSLMENES